MNIFIYNFHRMLTQDLRRLGICSEMRLLCPSLIGPSVSIATGIKCECQGGRCMSRSFYLLLQPGLLSRKVRWCQRVHYCGIPNQASAGFPWNEGDAISSFAFRSEQSLRFLHSWKSSFDQDLVN